MGTMQCDDVVLAWHSPFTADVRCVQFCSCTDMGCVRSDIFIH